MTTRSVQDLTFGTMPMGAYHQLQFCLNFNDVKPRDYFGDNQLLIITHASWDGYMDRVGVIRNYLAEYPQARILCCYPKAVGERYPDLEKHLLYRDWDCKIILAADWDDDPYSIVVKWQIQAIVTDPTDVPEYFRKDVQYV